MPVDRTSRDWGGDCEIVFTGHNEIVSRNFRWLGLPITAIGRVTPGKGIEVRKSDGEPISLRPVTSMLKPYGRRTRLFLPPFFLLQACCSGDGSGIDEPDRHYDHRGTRHCHCRQCGLVHPG